MNKTLTSKTNVMLFSVFTVAMVLLSACQPGAAPILNYGKVPVQDNPKPATAAPVAQPTTAAAMPVDTMVNMVNDAKLGPILVDEKGMTLYIYTKDAPDQSNCTAGCLAKWPPFTTTGTPKAGAGVDAKLLGTTKLADGSMIITYNKMPLYYWINDKKAGDTTGEGVGEVWYVVSPEGMAIKPQASIPVTGNEVMLNMVKDPTLGNILVDGKGMTLYIYTKDTPGVSTCKGGCLAAWPPFLSSGTVKAGEGVNQSLIGTAKLDDGTMIVTYNQMPLYYWKNDAKAGDTTGQGVGGVWYVISPDGKVVK